MALNMTLNLKAIDLTHVRHDPLDPLGTIMAWGSLLPVFIAFGGFTTHMMFRRELQTMFFCFGLACSEVINQHLKRFLKMPRPPTCERLETCDSNGMPSSHSQFMCFFSIYITLLVVRRLSFSDRYSYYFSALVCWPFAIFTMVSRVHLGYHSVPQVIVGGLVGLTLGTTWYTIVHWLFVPRFAAWSRGTICRYLCIKDDTHVENVLLFEYNNSEAARKSKEGTKMR